MPALSRSVYLISVQQNAVSNDFSHADVFRILLHLH